MGIFDKIFGQKKIKTKFDGHYELLDGHSPVFTTYDGDVYEMEVTRTCIDAFARHCSKLSASVSGPDLKRIGNILAYKPNEFMTTAQFLYKVATIYEAQNTCFIVPILDRFDRITGFYPVNPLGTEVVESNGEPYLRFKFRNGKQAAMELSKVGIVSKYLYKNDIFGEKNTALRHTLQMISMQNQGIQEGIKNSASFRFMASINNFSKDEDLTKYRKKFVEDNFGDDSGGLALFPNTMSNIQQINSTAKVVDTEQMQIIQQRVYNYFGVNDDILQNKCVGDSWSAYYEGKIEPFATQLSQAMTAMCFTDLEISRNNAIVWTSNKLQYMTTADKMNMASAMFDRGIFTLNDIMDMFNQPHVEDGDKRFIRREYMQMDDLNENNNDNEGETNDTIEQEEPEVGSSGENDAVAGSEQSEE